MVKAVIFDVDGTLVDTVDLHAQAWQDTFKEFGREVDFDKIRHQIGKGADQLIPVFFSEEEVEQLGKQMADRRYEIYKERYFSEAQVFPEVRALFERVKADNKKIVLSSSAKDESLQRYKAMMQVEDLVDAETVSEDAEQSKPAPDIFEAALQKLEGISPNEVMVVGDSPYDVEAANAIALPTIGVLCGGFSEAELREAGCIEIYQDPADLLRCYASSPLGSAE